MFFSYLSLRRNAIFVLWKAIFLSMKFSQIEGLGRPGSLQRRLLPNTQGHDSGGHEPAGEGLPRNVAVQHQRSVFSLRQILLPSAGPRRSQRPGSADRAAEQGAGHQARGHVQGLRI